MSNPFPFPTNLYRAIGKDPITVVAYEDDGVPAAVCVLATTTFERHAALVLLENSPASFVVSHGLRYSPDGRVEAYDPARPWYAGELQMEFEVEWVELGPQPQIYVFAHSQEEWEAARQAMKHLLHLGRLSPDSYLEGDYAGYDQGLSAQDLDGMPHGPGLVAQFRDAAIRAQNDEEEAGTSADFLSALVLVAKEHREQRAEDDEWWEEDEAEEFSGEYGINVS